MSLNAKKILSIEQDVLRVLKNIYDPEIPVNIYALGLIYDVGVSTDGKVSINMTLTAPTCPIADQIVENVCSEVSTVPNVAAVEVNLVFDPPWDKNMMSEEAKLELGFM
jgi:FeS assembly SUF system protein